MRYRILGWLDNAGFNVTVLATFDTLGRALVALHRYRVARRWTHVEIEVTRLRP